MTFKYDWFKDIEPVMDALVPPDSKRILEIGSFEGMSTVWFLDHCPLSRITCVDHFRGGEDQTKLDLDGLFERFAGNVKGYESRLTIFCMDSWDAMRHIESGSFDVVFVDGSHVAIDVIHDLTEAYRCVRKGGIVIADDYSWCNERPDCPKIAVDAFMACALDNAKMICAGRVYAFRKA